MARLKLTDANGTVYTFPELFQLRAENYETRSAVKDHMFAHGGSQQGDGFMRPRIVTVEGYMIEETAALFETAYREMMLAVMKGGKLWRDDDTVDRYIEVGNADPETEWILRPTYRRITITFDAVFPLWQDTTETATVTIETLDGDMIDRGDCEDAVSPMVAGETVPFTTNTTGVHDATKHYDGAYSFKIIKTVAAGTAAIYSMVDNASTTDLHGFIPGQYYSIDIYVFIPSGLALASEIIIQLVDYAGAWEYTTVYPVATYNAWQKVTVARLIRAAATGTMFRIAFDAASDINEYINIDAVHSTPRATLSITGGADHVVMPVVTVSADQGVNVPGVLLRNLSDGGSVFEYNNPLFTAGSVLTIDSAAGEIRLNGNLAMEYFVRGQFPRLQPGVNLIEYEGGAATVTYTFRKVYV